MDRSSVECVEDISVKRETALGRRNAKFRQCTKVGGICCIDPADMEFNGTMTHAVNKLELHLDSAMPCELRKTSGNSSFKAPEDPQEKIRDEHEL